jgi:hypothetical protein
MTDPTQPGANNPYGQPYNPYPPQPPKKRKIWPWLVIGIPVLLIGACTAVVVSSVGGDDDTSVTRASGETSAEAPADGPTFPGKLDEDTVAVAGDTITRDDLAYTVTPLESVPTVIGDYLCTNVTIKNVGDKQNDFNSYIDWSLQDASGTIRDATFAPERQPLNSGQIAPGGQTTGDVCFDAAQGAGPGTYVVLFKDTFSFSTDRLAWVNTL